MNGFVVIAKIAGTESTAKTTSAISIKTSAIKSGVTCIKRLPVEESCTRTKKRSS